MAELEVLPESRLGEFEQLVSSIGQELEPHVEGGLDLAPAEPAEAAGE